jgi:hypothetical protein
MTAEGYSPQLSYIFFDKLEMFTKRRLKWVKPLLQMASSDYLDNAAWVLNREYTRTVGAAAAKQDASILGPD